MGVGHYQVIGRKIPNNSDLLPPIYRLKIWATDPIRARSKFWYFMRKLCRLKKTKGHIISCNQIFERNPTIVKNFGLWIRFESRGGNHNAFKEYRDLTLGGAVKQLYHEMVSRYKTRAESIQLIKTSELSPKKCKRVNTTQYHSPKIRMPLIRKMSRPSSKKFMSPFKGRRPHLFWSKTSRNSFPEAVC